MKNDQKRLENYLVRAWNASGLTKWPSVREASAATRLPQKAIADMVDTGESMTTEYYNTKHVFGDRIWTARM